jgi:methionyl-tRNA formyltransferase
MRTLRVLFAGTAGATSSTALAALLAAGVQICGVATPSRQPHAPDVLPLHPAAEPSVIPLIQPTAQRNSVGLARERGIPVLALGRARGETVARAIADLQPDVACVACFPWKIAPELLALPAHGWLNLHPSLLPAHRGPAPLFWTFRHGETSTGVTVHWMDSRLDTGPIALQQEVELLEGSSWSEAEELLDQHGAVLLAQAIEQLEAGQLARRAQGTGGTYERWPDDADFSIDAGWPARRAFHFLRGVRAWGRPLSLALPAGRVEHLEALGYTPDAQLDTPVRHDGDMLHIRMNPGILHAHGRVRFDNAPRA